MENEMLIINNMDFKVCYQPIVNTDTDRIVSMEALVRPRTSWGKIESPQHIISYAEDHFMVDRIDRYVMDQMCHMIRRNNLDNGSMTFHINISPVELDNDQIVKQFNDLASKYEIPNQYFVIELLETKEMSSKRYEMLQRFKDYGFQVAMDDYGTGYSSVTRLLEFNFDCIKISKEMFYQVLANDKAGFLYSRIVSATREMGIDVVQEGIETEYQYEIIRRAGVNLAQGYFISKAVSEEKMINYLKDQRSVA